MRTYQCHPQEATRLTCNRKRPINASERVIHFGRDGPLPRQGEGYRRAASRSYTPTGLPVVDLSVATDEAYLDKKGKRQERVEWRRIVVIGKLGLSCNECLKKGRQVFVEGRLRTREVENNGSNGQRTEIIAAQGAVPSGTADRCKSRNAFGRRRPCR